MTATETPTSTETPSATPTQTLPFEVTDEATPFETLPPVVTETATPDFTPTDDMTPEPTETVIQPEPEMTVIFSEDFPEDGDLSNWLLGPGWFAGEGPTDHVLYLYNSEAYLTLNRAELSDFAVQFEFAHNYGQLRLEARKSPLGEYSVTADPTGLVSLYRSGIPLASAATPAIAPGQVRTLRLSIIGDVLRVQLNGVEIIAVRDAEPLPAGVLRLGFPVDGFTNSGNLGQNLAMIDTFRLSAPTTGQNSVSSSVLSVDRPQNFVLTPQQASCIAASANRDLVAYEDRPSFALKVAQLEVDASGRPIPDTFIDIVRIDAPLADITIVDHDIFDPALSPNGQEVAYAAQYRQVANQNTYLYHGLYVLNLNTCTIRTLIAPDYQPALPHNQERIASPDWSPDGTTLVYRRGFNTNASLYTIPAAGGTPTLLTTQGAHPSWSRDGSKIAFASSRNGGSEVYVYDFANPANPISQVTFGQGFVGTPAWSPLGERIAYAYVVHIRIINLLINAYELPLQNPVPRIANPEDPAWSPEGALVAFHAFPVLPDDTLTSPRLHYFAINDQEQPIRFRMSGPIVEENLDWWGVRSNVCFAPAGSGLADGPSNNGVACDLTIEIELVTGSITAPMTNGTFSYTITVTNQTALALTDVVVRDEVVTLLNGVRANTRVTNYTPGSNNPNIVVSNLQPNGATLTLLQLAAQASEAISITVTLNNYAYRDDGVLLHDAVVTQIGTEQAEFAKAELRLPQGLEANYYKGFEFSNPSASNQFIPATGGQAALAQLGSPANTPANFEVRQASYRLTGWLNVPDTGSDIRLTAIGDFNPYSGLRVWVGQRLVYSRWGSEAAVNIPLNPGSDQPLFAEFYFYVAPETLQESPAPVFAAPIITWTGAPIPFNEAIAPVRSDGGYAQVVNFSIPQAGTNETEQPGAMAYYAGCPITTPGIGRIQLVPVFTGQGQETLDMRAVTEFRENNLSPRGLVIHDGPT